MRKTSDKATTEGFNIIRKQLDTIIRRLDSLDKSVSEIQLIKERLETGDVDFT